MMLLPALLRLVMAQSDQTQPAAAEDETAPTTQPPPSTDAAPVDVSANDAPVAESPMDVASDITSKVIDHVEVTLSETTWVGWTILLAGVLVGVVGGKIVQVVLSRMGNRLRARGWTARGSLFAYAAGPANLAILAAGIYAGLRGVVMDPAIHTFAHKMVGLVYVIALAWFLYNLVDIVELAIRRFTSDNTIIQLIRKTLRIFLLVIFGLFVAQNFFGADITAWLAGLGLAGLAVSLAAQGPIKNLFGSVTVVLDRPFGLGDAIRFRDLVGTVEVMGFRSTKLRTMDGHLLTIPNSMLIEDMVQNITARPYLRRLFDITITYDTPPEKVEQAVQIIKDLLAEPFMSETFDLVKMPPRVNFNKFNADSLNIEVVYWYQLNVQGRDWWTFNAQSHQFNMRLLRAFAEAGIEFAFPTRTLYLAGDPNRQLSMFLQQDGNGLMQGDARARVGS